MWLWRTAVGGQDGSSRRPRADWPAAEGVGGAVPGEANVDITAPAIQGVLGDGTRSRATPRSPDDGARL